MFLYQHTVKSFDFFFLCLLLISKLCVSVSLPFATGSLILEHYLPSQDCVLDFLPVDIRSQSTGILAIIFFFGIYFVSWTHAILHY